MKELSECTVMIVDDTETNIDILIETLSEDYDIAVAMDGESALEYISEELPDLILLDIMMPGMSGYEVCRLLKKNKRTYKIPIIFVTAINDEAEEKKGLEMGAIDFIRKPFNPSIVKSRVKNHLELKIAKEKLEEQNDLLEKKVTERTKELTLTQDLTIYSLTSLAETRDPETGGHIQRTQNFVKALADKLIELPIFEEKLNESKIELLYKSAPLHDIGKIGVRDNILFKPAKLTEEEFEEMKLHTIYGHAALKKASDMFGTNSFFRYAQEIAYTHHEKWDGSGYPRGLKEEEIPLSGRLMALADVYDALVSKRVYKPSFSHERAVKIILEGRGSHFDPTLVDAFYEINDIFRKIALNFADFDEERISLAKKNNGLKKIMACKK
ncbi:chemotaxis protein CheY [Candidatus Magnetomorum sp. HK-1]|nr:chemotaxis protein CheY [Candidatus Magnetomorum sp. HK-1]